MSADPRHIAEFINQFDKRDDPFDFFNWSEYYDELDPNRDVEDEGSMPGLTQDGTDSSPTPSETTSSPPSVPAENQLHYKERLREVKRQDDKLTIPGRDIRPKGQEYPHQIHIHNPPSPSGGDLLEVPSVANHELSNSPFIRETASSAPLIASRGRRKGPLENPEEVAGVRQLKACTRCRILKIKCDLREICSACTAEAEKLRPGLSPMAKCMCDRNVLSSNESVFREILSIEKNASPRNAARNHGTSSESLICRVYFDEDQYSTLELAVLRQHTPSSTGSSLLILDLDRSYMPEEKQLIHWAAEHMKANQYSSMEVSLDALMMTCLHSRSPYSPHLRLLQMVHEFRCMWIIWRQARFNFQQGSRLAELPESIRMAIHRIATSALRRMEPDLLKLVDSLAVKDAKEPTCRLHIWVALMELIMMYRTLIPSPGQSSRVEHVATGAGQVPGLYSSNEKSKKLAWRSLCALLVVTNVLFKKNKMQKPGSKDDQIYSPQIISAWSCAVDQWTEFLQKKPTPPDEILLAFLAEPGRPRSRPRSNKKQKTS